MNKPILYDVTRMLTNRFSYDSVPNEFEYKVNESYYRDGLIYVVVDDREYEIAIEVTEVR